MKVSLVEIPFFFFDGKENVKCDVLLTSASVQIALFCFENFFFNHEIVNRTFEAFH